MPRRLSEEATRKQMIDPKIEANYKRSRIVGDEILIACVGSIGRVALVNEQMKGFNIVRAVARRVPANYELLNRLYLAAYLSTPFVIEETPVLVPPLSLQEEFAGVVARVESMRQVEGLFESLLSESFAQI